MRREEGWLSVGGNDTDDSRFDAVVTHFFLDCFTAAQLEEVIGKLTGALQPSGRWLISDFREAEGGFARARSRAVLGIMYTFFRIVTRLPANTLTKVDPILARNGLYLENRRIRNLGLLHSDVWRKEVILGR